MQMAADFPPNLDDGELWLPPEIIPDLGVYRHVPAGLRLSDFNYIEELAKELAAFGLLDRTLPDQLIKPTLNRERLMAAEAAARFGMAVDPVLKSGYLYEGVRSPAAMRAETGAYFSGPWSHLEFGPGKPVQAHGPVPTMDGFRPIRGRVLQIQPNRFIAPVRPAGSLRESVGTGVFLPRVALDNDGKRKPHKFEGERRRGTVVPVRSLTPELKLPHDWTY